MNYSELLQLARAGVIFIRDRAIILRLHVINRLRKYHDNFFAWMEDFSLPHTNNLSERELRGAKTKKKVSGQFESIQYAGYYSDILTYTRTCRKNGINEIDALSRLMQGNPLTVREIFPEFH